MGAARHADSITPRPSTSRCSILPVYVLTTIVFSFYLFVPRAACQTPERKFEVFAQAGLSSYNSASRAGVLTPPPAPGVPSSINFVSRNRFPVTGRLFAGFRHRFTPNNAWEASYSYSPNDLVRSENSVGVASDRVDLSVHNVAFNYVRYFASRGRIRPFATAGAGFVIFDASFKDKTGRAGNFGGGLDVVLGSRLTLRFEFRDFVSARPKIDADIDPEDTLHNFVPSVGLALRF